MDTKIARISYKLTTNYRKDREPFFIWEIGDKYANLVILATPVRIIGH